MIDNAHPALFPPTANCTLWRYMDFTKLLAIFEDRQLYFPRADLFQDPYEGRLSRVSVEALRNPSLNPDLPPEAPQMILDSTDRMRQTMYVSCWHMSDHESAAMWKLYVQSNEGVAIRSDHDSLLAVLASSPLRARTSMVQYIDYESAPVPMGYHLSTVLHKRMSFAHERELRAVIWALEDVNAPQIWSQDLVNNPPLPPSPSSIQVDVEPGHLIKAVHVSPTAPEWFGRLVEKVVAKYEVGCKVERSSLYDRPTY